MSARKPPANAPKTVVADDPDDRKGRLKDIGGSQSDHWNNILANQAVQALWVKNSSPEERDKQLSATIAALIGIAPKDELEGMMAAQLVAAHNAAMECYRRAMIGEQTFEGRRENLAQANKLSRTYAALLARNILWSLVSVTAIGCFERPIALKKAIELRNCGARGMPFCEQILKFWVAQKC